MGASTLHSPSHWKLHSFSHNLYSIYLLLQSEIACSNPALAFRFQRNKMFLLCSLVKIRYCGEPLWPGNSELGLRPPGFEFRVSCLEGRLSSRHPLAQLSPRVNKSGLLLFQFIFLSVDQSSGKLTVNDRKCLSARTLATLESHGHNKTTHCWGITDDVLAIIYPSTLPGLFDTVGRMTGEVCYCDEDVCNKPGSSATTSGAARKQSSRRHYYPTIMSILMLISQLHLNL